MKNACISSGSVMPDPYEFLIYFRQCFGIVIFQFHHQKHASHSIWVRVWVGRWHECFEFGVRHRMEFNHSHVPTMYLHSSKMKVVDILLIDPKSDAIRAAVGWLALDWIAHEKRIREPTLDRTQGDRILHFKQAQDSDVIWNETIFSTSFYVMPCVDFRKWLFSHFMSYVKYRFLLCKSTTNITCADHDNIE